MDGSHVVIGLIFLKYELYFLFMQQNEFDICVLCVTVSYLPSIYVIA